jgi:EF-P beta-lysylation protein EpmB
MEITTQHNWQQDLKQAYKSPQQLCLDLHLDIASSPYQIDFAASFNCLVPQDFVAQMQKNNWHDPLLLQVLPLQIENNNGGVLDPVGEHGIASFGLIHKYHGRALWVLSSGCAINCRYCFRRHFAYTAQVQSTKNWDQVIARITADKSIKEIILSGGDPLLFNDELLQQLFFKLEAIPHISTIRIHSRLPIVLPNRVTPALLAIFAGSSKQVVMVVHCNHAQEISPKVNYALQQLAANVVALFNQSVLLAGVNATATTLCELSERLFASKCLPYYIHMLDEVAGSMHFKVSANQAKLLLTEVAARLPGYLVPKLVRDVAGSKFKLSV